MKTFYTLLANNAIAAVVNFTVWFAITFFVFLETESVFANGIIAGIYLVFTAASGIWFGGIVDHNKKRTVMMVSSLVSFFLYIAATGIFFMAPREAFGDVSNAWLWSFVLLLMIGVIAGNLRTIAFPTLVTLLVPEDRRDKANGLVGMITGLSFGTVSVISGLMIAHTGMEGVLLFTLVFTLIAIVHLLFVRVPEENIIHLDDRPKKLDLKGTYALVVAVPGLAALILFATFNNFLGGSFMALLDPYGLSMVSVELWGFILGALSFSFVFGGMAIAKWGLGKNPLRTMLTANVIIWIACILFTIQPLLWLLIAGMFVWMFTMPFIEASEHTLIQKVVPFERQGRVFGFAQSVEQAASPLTAFLIAPLTQFVFIPFMTVGVGAEVLGPWFGTGMARGIALVFTVTGFIGLIATILAFASRPYRLLSERYQEPA
ncbi:MAG TPA: MFS transporter [Candidatus Paceibacterota bacterium]|nr:MFS transporter [Candidatus Paceibacterota bacterium]